jgi:hypothetical protein
MTTTDKTPAERLAALFARTTTDTLITSLRALTALGQDASGEERWARAKTIEELERRYPAAGEAVGAAYLAAEIEMQRDGKVVEVDYVEVLLDAIAREPITITVTRFKLYPARGRSGRYAWKWSYNYTVSGDPMVCQYGAGLGDLRAMLRRKYPKATIVETWKG